MLGDLQRLLYIFIQQSPKLRRVFRAAEQALSALSAKGADLLRVGLVERLPDLVTRAPDGELQTTALQIEDGAITAIYVMPKRDKLRHPR